MSLPWCHVVVRGTPKSSENDASPATGKTYPPEVRVCPPRPAFASSSLSLVSASTAFASLAWSPLIRRHEVSSVASNRLSLVSSSANSASLRFGSARRRSRRSRVHSRPSTPPSARSSACRKPRHSALSGRQPRLHVRPRIDECRRAWGERLIPEGRGQLEHVFDVPLCVVVGEDRALDVLVPPGRSEVARGGEDRVLGIPRVGDPIPVGVHPPAHPGGGNELHPAERSGRARAHVLAVAGLDLVDRAEHLPRNAVCIAGLLPERDELRIGANLGRRGRARERRGDADRARGVRHPRAGNVRRSCRELARGCGNGRQCEHGGDGEDAPFH